MKYGHIDWIVLLIYMFYTGINYWLRLHDPKNWNFHWIYLRYESKFQMLWSLKSSYGVVLGNIYWLAPSVATSYEIPSDPCISYFLSSTFWNWSRNKKMSPIMTKTINLTCKARNANNRYLTHLHYCKSSVGTSVELVCWGYLKWSVVDKVSV